MPNQKFKVTYQDGSERTVLVTPLAEFLAEEKFGGIFNNTESLVRISYFLAWRSLHQAGQEPAEFTAWLEKISDVEDVTPKAVRDRIAGVLIRADAAESDEGQQILDLAEQLDKRLNPDAGGPSSPS